MTAFRYYRRVCFLLLLLFIKVKIAIAKTVFGGAVVVA